MKQRIAGALLLLASTIPCWASHAHAQGLPPVTNFKLEAAESAVKKAPILLLVMSKTCNYCEQALKEFLLPMQQNPEYADKAILRQIDIANKNRLIDFNGKTTTQAVYAKTHKALAVPTVLLLDDKGNELERITGLTNIDFYQAYLDKAIDESREKMQRRGK